MTVPSGLDDAGDAAAVALPMEEVSMSEEVVSLPQALKVMSEVAMRPTSGTRADFKVREASFTSSQSTTVRVYNPLGGARVVAL